MGTFHEPIEIRNPARRGKPVRLDALVDTGAAYTLIPGKVLRNMGVKPSKTRRFKLADGRIIARKMGLILAKVKGDETPTWAIFGDERADPLLGALTLEELGFGVDSLHRTLVAITTFPMCPSRKR
ncbi:MAG: retroviral-like aspartic protease family protein [Elusimicrobia bacterium]|nr:retroviral-like aspartic protease family protein [Elusimicrobiota bacterium]